jgi:hypothetical protein
MKFEGIKMDSRDIGILALVAIFALVGAFSVSYAIPAVSAANPPMEDGTGPYIDYTSTYGPADGEGQDNANTGVLYVRVLSEQNLFSKGIVIKKLVQTNPGFAIPNGVVAAGVIESNFRTVGPSATYALNANGGMDTILPAGVYGIVLADGNNGQPEYAVFALKATQTLKITLIGHGVTPADAKPRTIIDKATYGKIVKVIDREATPGTPAQTHTDFEVGHVHARQVSGHSGHDFVYRGDKYQITGNSHDAAFVVYNYYYVRPATVVVFIDVPATPAVTEVSHMEGSYIDVTAQVQAVVDSGVTSFRFNNAMNPGGIVNVDQTVVLAQIDDPAVNIVKDVVIEYNGQTIETQEYQLINL